MIDRFKLSLWLVVTAFCIAFWSMLAWVVTYPSWTKFIILVVGGPGLLFAGFVCLCMVGFAGQGRET